MPHIGAQAVFVIVLMFATTVKTSGDVTFWRDKVTVKCEKDFIVYDAEGKNVSLTNEYEFTYKRQIKYMCKNSVTTKSYIVYIRGRACENCFELDGKIFLAVIIVDVFGTAVVMMIIYRCSKKKSSDSPSKPTKPTPRAGGRAPPVPNPDYESLNLHTISSDTYSTMNTGMVNRTG